MVTTYAWRKASGAVESEADLALSALDETVVAPSLRGGAPLNAPSVHELVHFLHRATRITRSPPECIVLAAVHMLRAAACAPPREKHTRLLLLASLHLAHKTHEDRAIAMRDWPTVWAYAATGCLPPPPPPVSTHATSHCRAPSTPHSVYVADIANAEAALLKLLKFRVGVARDTYVRVYWAVREAAKEACRGKGTVAGANPPQRPLTAGGGRLVRGIAGGGDGGESKERDALWDPRSPRGSRSTAAAVLARAEQQGGQRRATSCERPVRAVSRLVLS